MRHRVCALAGYTGKQGRPPPALPDLGAYPLGLSAGSWESMDLDMPASAGSSATASNSPWRAAAYGGSSGTAGGWAMSIHGWCSASTQFWRPARSIPQASEFSQIPFSDLAVLGRDQTAPDPYRRLAVS
jgi:hypothetical protein